MAAAGDALKKQAFGVIGLDVMGKNLARNVERNGFSVAVYNRTWARTEALVNGPALGRNVEAARTLVELVDRLERPRKILLIANLLLAEGFRAYFALHQDAWRRTLRAAVSNGIATPAQLASLAYYDTCRRERLLANLIQAQRDLFGAHTYERIDRPGAFHTDRASGTERERGSAAPPAFGRRVA